MGSSHEKNKIKADLYLLHFHNYYKQIEKGEN